MGQPFDKPQALFYGKFVQAAYTMYRHPGADPLRPEPQGIPDGYELGAWIHMSDFILDIVEPKFYGVVAHKVEDPACRVIAIRGTEGATEWIDDAAAVPVPFHQVPAAGRVAYGFDKIYKTLKVVKRTLPSERALAAPAPETFEGSFAEQLEQLALIREAAGPRRPMVAELGRPRRSTIVAGHSLGAALCTLFTMENADKRKFDIDAQCTFASPRVGNMEFVQHFNRLSIDSWRVVNRPDLVPRLPPHIPVLLDYDHVDTETPFSSRDFAKHNLLCYHVMETYLHWLSDGKLPLLPECQP
ncbi:MAG TPA: lipase family protein [Terriglobales bacterium]|nr:lipase family protein [Terriglobales bacterium]